MIKDVMVQLNGTSADDIRLLQASAIAERFEAYLTGLFLNILPFPELIEAGYAAAQSADLIDKARKEGDRKEAALSARLSTFARPARLRRLDVFWDDIPGASGREARCTDVFVSLRPDREIQETESVIEGVLFGSGRHVIATPAGETPKAAFDNIVIGWNGSREAARAVSEALPYLRLAKTVTVIAIDAPEDVEQPMGSDVVLHLDHHGVTADLHQAKSVGGDVAGTLTEEASLRNADLIVIGGYGHSRLREWLLGGVTYKLLHTSPLPLLLAH